jgi:hypothetical protein
VVSSFSRHVSSNLWTLPELWVWGSQELVTLHWEIGGVRLCVGFVICVCFDNCMGLLVICLILFIVFLLFLFCIFLLHYIQIDTLQFLMVLRIYTLSGDARHNTQYVLKNSIIYSAAYLRNGFLWQSANYVNRYFPAVNGQYDRRLRVLWIKILPRIKLLQKHILFTT